MAGTANNLWALTADADDGVGSLDGSVAAGTPAYGAAGVSNTDPDNALEIDFGDPALNWQNLSYPGFAATILFPLPAGFCIGNAKFQIQRNGTNLEAIGFNQDTTSTKGQIAALAGISAGYHRVLLALNDSGSNTLWIDGVAISTSGGNITDTRVNLSTTVKILGLTSGNSAVKGMVVYSAGTDAFGQTGADDVADDYAAFPNPATTGGAFDTLPGAGSMTVGTKYTLTGTTSVDSLNLYVRYGAGTPMILIKPELNDAGDGTWKTVFRIPKTCTGASFVLRDRAGMAGDVESGTVNFVSAVSVSALTPGAGGAAPAPSDTPRGTGYGSNERINARFSGKGYPLREVGGTGNPATIVVAVECSGLFDVADEVEFWCKGGTLTVATEAVDPDSGVTAFLAKLAASDFGTDEVVSVYAYARPDVGLERRIGPLTFLANPSVSALSAIYVSQTGTGGGLTSGDPMGPDLDAAVSAAVAADRYTIIFTEAGNYTFPNDGHATGDTRTRLMTFAPAATVANDEIFVTAEDGQLVAMTPNLSYARFRCGMWLPPNTAAMQVSTDQQVVFEDAYWEAAQGWSVDDGPGTPVSGFGNYAVYAVHSVAYDSVYGFSFIPHCVGNHIEKISGSPCTNSDGITSNVTVVNTNGTGFLSTWRQLNGTRTGTFTAGETVTQATSGASGTLVRCGVKMVLSGVTGTADATHTWTGGASGATFVPDGSTQTGVPNTNWYHRDITHPFTDDYQYNCVVRHVDSEDGYGDGVTGDKANEISIHQHGFERAGGILYDGVTVQVAEVPGTEETNDGGPQYSDWHPARPLMNNVVIANGDYRRQRFAPDEAGNDFFYRDVVFRNCILHFANYQSWIMLKQALPGMVFIGCSGIAQQHAITDLAAVDASGTVTITWTDSWDPGHGVNHKLFRSNNGGVTWTELTDAAASPQTDTLPAGATHLYYVEARDNSIGNRKNSNVATVGAAASADATAPGNVQMAAEVLTWDANDAGENVKCYRVARAATGTDSFAWIGSVSGATLTYTDAGGGLSDYDYRISAVSGAGEESVLSELAALQVPSGSGGMMLLMD